MTQTNPGLPGLILPDAYEGLCAEWMPRARTWCGLKPGHRRNHCSPASLERERSTWGAANAARYPGRMANAEGRKQEKKYAADKYARHLAMVATIKMMSGCVDCGFDAYPEALEFDHLPGTVKVQHIATLARGSLKRLFEEMEKTEVVCSNCHRRRTTRRNQWGRGVPRAERTASTVRYPS